MERLSSEERKAKAKQYKKEGRKLPGPTPKKITKSAWLSFALFQWQKDRIQGAAKASGLSTNEWLRITTCRAAGITNFDSPTAPPPVIPEVKENPLG